MSPCEDAPFEKLAEATALWEEFIAARRTGSKETEAEFLARHEHLRELLEPMLAEDSLTMTADAPGDEDLDLESFGPYRVIRRMGSGGMGSVYLVDQREPVARRVALKVIKLGMDSRQVLARFAVERQALALMNHDNIAKVFDAGTTPRGQPYFVMEHVAGLPLNEHCDNMRLRTAERLRVFQKVCHGVQHAHQKGIIHRDIKPSNILVSVDQGMAVPKIIDFGLARATGARLGTLVTGHGQAIGTPQYMSPEQAEMSSQDIDTRTDIYSLGVTLYELLVGKPPWSSEDVASAGGPVDWRRVFETEPQKPSTKLSSGIADSERFAKLRKTSPKVLARELRGDLDWITMKALERDRNRRYNSAAEFAADIERFLSDQPVLASPPSLTYRLNKFVRRNRWQVVAAVLFTLSLIAGVIGTGFGMVEARERAAEADSARADEQRARKDAEQWLDRYNLLAVGPELTATQRAESKLIPPHPDTEPKIRSWLEQRAEPLMARMEDVTGALGKLRALAPERTPAEVKRDHDEHPANRRLIALNPKLKMFQGQLKVLRASDPFNELEIVAERVQQMVERQKAHRKRLEERQTWRLPSETKQFLHDALTDLQEQLETFRDGDLARVKDLHEWVRTIEHRSVGAFSAEWDKTIQGIRALDAYHGLTIKPQVGLVPLGKDPESGLFEFVHLRSGTRDKEIPVRDPVTCRLQIHRHTGIVFVLIPGDVAWIGAQRDPGKRNFDPQAAANESPVRKVRLDPFFLSKYEITQAQWKRLTGREPSVYRAGDYVAHAYRMRWQHPVENVSWQLAYTTMRGEGFVLPTEAQWEYACRAGSDGAFSTGKKFQSLQGFANLSDRTAHSHATWAYEDALEDGHLLHAPVGVFKPNQFGLHDMHGNVYEWSLDPKTRYIVVPREGDGLRNPPGSGLGITRGGCYQSKSTSLRTAARNPYPTDHRSHIVGVRAARKLHD